MSLIPYQSDYDIVVILTEYDEQAFSDMPYWLRNTINARSITFDRRDPTPQEIEETIQDGIDHRLAYNERNIDDFKRKYMRK